MPNKAAVTLTLEELELDAAMSQRRRGSSGNATSMTGLKAEKGQGGGHFNAAFSLASRASRAGQGSLFDDEEENLAGDFPAPANGCAGSPRDDTVLPCASAAAGEAAGTRGRRDGVSAVLGQAPAALLPSELALLQCEPADFLEDDAAHVQEASQGAEGVASGTEGCVERPTQADDGSAMLFGAQVVAAGGSAVSTASAGAATGRGMALFAGVEAGAEDEWFAKDLPLVTKTKAK